MLVRPSPQKKKKKKKLNKKNTFSGFWSRFKPTHQQLFIDFFFFCCETMSNGSQNCWIDWNSAVLCFNLFTSGILYFFRSPVRDYFQ